MKERLQKGDAAAAPEKKCTNDAGEPVWCHGATPASDIAANIAETDASRPAVEAQRAADKRAVQERRVTEKPSHDERRATERGASTTNSTIVPDTHAADAALADDASAAGAATVTGKHKKKLALIHIPKTGGTSLEEAGIEQGFFWGKHFKHWASLADPKGAHCSVWHVPPGMFPTDPYAAFDTFCTTRHPYTRAISQYLFWTAATDDGCNGTDPTEDCPEVIAQVCNATGLNAYIHKTTTAIQSGVAAITGLSGPVDRDAQAEDCHWLPQWMYIGEGGSKLCEHVLRQENLETDMAALLEGRDEDLGLMAVRQALAGHRYKRVSSCTLQVGDLDSESRKALQQIFSRDFEALGYDPELPPATAILSTAQSPGQPWRLRQETRVGLDGFEMEEVHAIRRMRAARNQRTRAEVKRTRTPRGALVM